MSWAPGKSSSQPQIYGQVLLIYDLKDILTIDVLGTLTSGRNTGSVGFLEKFSQVSTLEVGLFELTSPESRISWNGLKNPGETLFTFVVSRIRKKGSVKL